MINIIVSRKSSKLMVEISPARQALVTIVTPACSFSSLFVLRVGAAARLRTLSAGPAGGRDDLVIIIVGIIVVLLALHHHETGTALPEKTTIKLSCKENKKGEKNHSFIPLCCSRMSGLCWR
jgi:hypothetical protein